MCVEIVFNDDDVAFQVWECQSTSSSLFLLSASNRPTSTPLKRPSRLQMSFTWPGWFLRLFLITFSFLQAYIKNYWSMPTEGSGFERGAASNTKEPCSNPRQFYLTFIYSFTVNKKRKYYKRLRMTLKKECACITLLKNLLSQTILLPMIKMSWK